jgi:4-alpha-glucanotransferase
VIHDGPTFEQWWKERNEKKQQKDPEAGEVLNTNEIHSQLDTVESNGRTNRQSERGESETL